MLQITEPHIKGCLLVIWSRQNTGMSENAQYLRVRRVEIYSDSFSLDLRSVVRV